MVLVGLIIRNTIRINWSMIIRYVVFLTCLAATLTPEIGLAVRLIAGVVGGYMVGTIATHTLWWKK
jgi:hypothetical protein